MENRCMALGPIPAQLIEVSGRRQNQLAYTVARTYSRCDENKTLQPTNGVTWCRSDKEESEWRDKKHDAVAYVGRFIDEMVCRRSELIISKNCVVVAVLRCVLRFTVSRLRVQKVKVFYYGFSDDVICGDREMRRKRPRHLRR